ncbi:hypothetical protein PPL_08367 [Heterostelium album PN500]|uniref:B box-type domain-containing protein n=1 Tax=Heterostelium pallidum (strain ATCC 26659 / Pp 5 / PN500) TaxID=670386 RepID=D3BHZ9_HETP5|nr:hypothetical protein PPL_08367 [Heterostelium album PN500]EFA78899.1 hypothetical protein PPL_08367 [Heterostelium album PN500]|eukprot:XP_020431023.1 hypothetical protein PPL_08367 [Heterostelium album PN500]
MKQCVIHKEKLDILCSDCNVVICYRCQLSKHKQHYTLHTDEIKQSILDIDYSVSTNNDKIDSENEKKNNNISKDKNNDSTDKDKDNSNIIQKRIEWLWNKSKESVNHIQKLSEIENEISDHFKQYYEMLMKEENKLKQPIIDELDQTKQQLDQIIKEIQSLNNIIQSITPTLKPDPKSNDIDKLDDNNNNSNEYDILSDSTINYSLPILIESIKQSTTLEQFIHNNSNTIFNIKQQNNNEIIEYLNNNNEINKNKRHKNNNNIKTNNNDNSILEIIRHHFDQYKIDIRHILNKNDDYISVTKSQKNQSYFNGIRHFIKESLQVNFNNSKETRYIITKDKDNVISLYNCDFTTGNQMELMENESKQLMKWVKQMEKYQDTISVFFASSNTTIYLFTREISKFIAYSINDNTFREGSFCKHDEFDFIYRVSTFASGMYLYFYGIDRGRDDQTTIIRFNTFLEEFEQFQHDNTFSRRTIPIAMFELATDDSENYLYTIYYDSFNREMVLVEYQMFSTVIENTYDIPIATVPTFVSYCYDGESNVYLYYGDAKSDYFIQINLYKMEDDPEELKTIKGRAKVTEAIENQVLVLTPMIYEYVENDEKLYLFTNERNYVYSINNNQWKQSHLKTSNVRMITDLMS